MKNRNICFTFRINEREDEMLKHLSDLHNLKRGELIRILIRENYIRLTK